MPSSSQLLDTIKPKYLPNKQLVLDAKLLRSNPYEGAKLAFSFAMSPLHALAATRLYRYLLRLNDSLTSEKSSTHQADYKQENQHNLEQNLNLIKHIYACIFYLFIEVDKNWQEVNQDPIILYSIWLS